jgi:hypothetical protein
MAVERERGISGLCHGNEGGTHRKPKLAKLMRL